MIVNIAQNFSEGVKSMCRVFNRSEGMHGNNSMLFIKSLKPDVVRASKYSTTQQPSYGPLSQNTLWSHLLISSANILNKLVAALCGMPTIQYSAQSTRFCKLNDLHVSTSLCSIMMDFLCDSTVDQSSLPASALCAVRRQLLFDVAENLEGGFLYGMYRLGNDSELITMVTSSAAAAERPHEPLSQLKSCQLLHNCTKNHI